jgi:hypothetical protein
MSQTPTARQAEAAVTRINQLTERMLTAARNAGGGFAEAHEKALRDMAEFETKTAGRSQLDWLQALAQTHAKFVTDLASMYGDAIKKGLPG